MNGGSSLLHDVVDIFEELEAFLIHSEVLSILQEVESNEHLLLVGLGVGQVNDKGGSCYSRGS